MPDKVHIKKIVQLFVPYRKWICIVMFMLSFTSLVSLCVPLITKKIIDQGFLVEDLQVVTLYALLGFSLVVVQKGLEIWSEQIRTNIYTDLKFNLHEIIFNHITQLNIRYFREKNISEIFNNIRLDIENMMKVADSQFFFLLTQVLSLVGGLIGLLILDWRLTLVVLCFVPIKFVSANFFAKQREKYVESYIEDSGNYAAWFGDTIGGIREVKLFNLLTHKKREFSRQQRRLIGLEKKLDMLNIYSIAVDFIVLDLLLALIYIFGATLVTGSSFSVGGVIAFITYSTYVTTPISSILNIRYYISDVLPSAKRYFDFFDMEIEDNDYLTPECSKEHLNYENNPKTGKIEFENVNYTYGSQLVLQNINCVIEPGQKVAIIGDNGSGKSTWIDLLLRFHKPNSGVIRLGDINVEEYNLAHYRELISVVSQHTYLFDASILDNIKLYSHVNANIVEQIIKDAQLDINNINSRGNETVGANGLKLSGGQRQKIALARSLLYGLGNEHKRGSIYVFDEATANLDSESELHINALLNHQLKEATVIIVTHQREVLQRVDRIFMLSNGNMHEVTDSAQKTRLTEAANNDIY